MEGNNNEEPWESLDIDETDLSTSSLPLLRRCNHRHTIPGPAAAVQAAMHRSKQPPHTPLSTQEFIRKAELDSGDDFLRNPWLFALDFLRIHGVGDTTSLRDVKNCVNAERFDRVVAIVKSCRQNGFGDMKITLKDPTDTIEATVHGKVLSAGEFGKLITVGSILILQKVVAFSSSYLSCYLNITRRNISKIISVDCEVHNFPEGYQDSYPVLSGNTAIPERASALVCRTERAARDEIRSFGTEGRAKVVDLTRNEYCLLSRSQNNTRQSKFFADKSLEEPVHDLVDSGHSASDSNCKRGGDISGRTSQLGPGSLEGIFRSLQDLDKDVRQQARECSSAPSLIENLGSRNWKANDAEAGKLPVGNDCSVSNSEKFETVVMPNNVYLDICNVDDSCKQKEARVGSSSAPDIVEKLAKRDISELNGGPKSTQVAVSGGDSSVVAERDDQASKGANGLKKQRLALVSRTAVQEWTDEQLCILDMDED